MVNELRKVKTQVTGEVSGWAAEGEDDYAAIRRLVLLSEMSANSGEARLHLSLPEPTLVSSSITSSPFGIQVQILGTIGGQVEEGEDNVSAARRLCRQVLDVTNNSGVSFDLSMPEQKRIL